MEAKELLRLVKELDDGQPLHKKLERELKIGPGFGRARYKNQKEHWISWLTDYHTSGPYGRLASASTPAEVVYNRLMCPPMVFWLAEASGVSHGPLHDAFEAALVSRLQCASQSAAIRRSIPWCDVEQTLAKFR